MAYVFYFSLGVNNLYLSPCRIGHSRAVYEVNLSEDHEPVPGSSLTSDPKVRRQEELPIPMKTAVLFEKVFFLF